MIVNDTTKKPTSNADINQLVANPAYWNKQDPLHESVTEAVRGWYEAHAGKAAHGRAPAPIVIDTTQP